jgi:hypothetical protein
VSGTDGGRIKRDESVKEKEGMNCSGVNGLQGDREENRYGQQNDNRKTAGRDD